MSSSSARQNAQHVRAERTQFGADPENKLLSRFPRRRLEAEAIYDAMRSTTNMIPRQESGAPLDYEKSGQRAMYILTNGRAPQGMRRRGAQVLHALRLRHRPPPRRSTPGRRPRPPPQSLFWMNSPLVKFMADRFADGC